MTQPGRVTVTMNTVTSQTPRREIRKIVKGLQLVIDGLTRVLSRAASYATAPRPTKVDKPIKRAKRVVTTRAKVKTTRKVRTTPTKATNRLPKHLLKHVGRLTKVKSNRLTEEQVEDIKKLLAHSPLSVQQIATLFKRTPQAIYTIRDRHKLAVHKGSPQLVAGVKRAQKEGKMNGPGKRQTSVAVPQEPVAAGA